MTLQIHLFIRINNDILVAHDWFSFSSDFIERYDKYKQIKVYVNK